MSWQVIQPQCQGQWCWASVTEYVSRVYGRHPPLSQGQVADPFFAQQDCTTGCDPNAGPVCNERKELCEVLRKWSLIAKVEDSASADEIGREVTEQRPVAFRVGNHFAVISRRLKVSGATYFEVMDPAGGLVRYVEENRFLNLDYACRGCPDLFYFTAHPGTEDIQCPGYDQPEVFLFSARDQVASALRGLGQKMIQGWESVVRERLEQFIDSQEVPPLDHREIEVSDPIPVLGVKLGKRFETCGGFAFLLTSRTTGEGMGVLEFSTPAVGKWLFKSLAVAPGEGGDRYMQAIIEARSRLSANGRAALLRIPSHYVEVMVLPDQENLEFSVAAELQGAFSFGNLDGLSTLGGVMELLASV